MNCLKKKQHHIGAAPKAIVLRYDKKEIWWCELACRERHTRTKSARDARLLQNGTKTSPVLFTSVFVTSRQPFWRDQKSSKTETRLKRLRIFHGPSLQDRKDTSALSQRPRMLQKPLSRSHSLRRSHVGYYSRCVGFRNLCVCYCMLNGDCAPITWATIASLWAVAASSWALKTFLWAMKALCGLFKHVRGMLQALCGLLQPLCRLLQPLCELF